MQQTKLFPDETDETIRLLEKRIAMLEAKINLCFPAKHYDLEKAYKKSCEIAKQTEIAI